MSKRVPLWRLRKHDGVWVVKIWLPWGGLNEGYYSSVMTADSWDEACAYVSAWHG